MITHDLRWSLARGNPLVPCCWQATHKAPIRQNRYYKQRSCYGSDAPRGLGA